MGRGRKMVRSMEKVFMVDSIDGAVAKGALR